MTADVFGTLDLDLVPHPTDALGATAAVTVRLAFGPRADAEHVSEVARDLLARARLIESLGARHAGFRSRLRSAFAGRRHLTLHPVELSELVRGFVS